MCSGAALTHLNRLDCFQAHVENMCGFTFPSLTNHRNASILSLTCRLWLGRGAAIYNPSVLSLSPPHLGHLIRRLHGFDPASHLRLYNPCNFHILYHFHHSWQATVISLWNLIPASILLQRDSKG